VLLANSTPNTDKWSRHKGEFARDQASLRTRQDEADAIMPFGAEMLLTLWECISRFNHPRDASL